MNNAKFKNINKRIQDKKKNQKMKYQRGKVQGAKAIRDQQAALHCTEEESKSEDEENPILSEEDSDAEAPGHFYVKFKEPLVP